MKYTMPTDLLKLVSRNELDTIFRMCEKHLEVFLPVDLYIEEDMGSSVGEMEIEKDRVKIYLTSKKVSKAELIRTIFHEMAHAKQIVEGRLVSTYKKLLWEGVSGLNWAGIEYNETPWEKDANHWEDVLYRMYISK